jgi:hypothetical protein
MIVEALIGVCFFVCAVAVLSIPWTKGSDVYGDHH